MGALVLVIALMAWELFGPPGVLHPDVARFSRALDATSTSISARDALGMDGLREVCVIPEYTSVDDVFAPHGYRMKSGVQLKPEARFKESVIFAHTGLLAIDRDRQIYLLIDLMRDDVARLSNVDFECFSGDDAVLLRKESGWWALKGTKIAY